MLSISTLVFVTFIWGVTFPIIKDVFLYLSPVNFLALRFAVSTLLFLPVVIKKIKHVKSEEWKAGLIAGTLLFIAYYLQTIGLLYTQPALSGTITGIYVVFVPIISYLYLRRRIAHVEVYSSAFAFIGLVLMSYSGLSNVSIELGDFMTLAAAVFYAMQLVYVSKHASHIDTFVFSFIQIAVAAFFSAVFIPTFPEPFKITIYSAFVVLFTAVFATFLATYVYVSALSKMNVTKVGVILIGEPIFADLTSVILYGEKIGPIALIGIIIMIASIGTISYFAD
ncbi:hypothetical protein [Thermoplasma volcanium GSS1]|uniref:EamA domain-containing protein n=1 Tax=Thermoplasma volcanium (strain ATCC 51530 / DSM 4299 / JCM 9571 / NBRC 15438 / GSS1) TaxID=273116 RepID=Q977Z4_THEVO|nr:hypothetical protein [Thermoplasma volcanium GSS1]